MYTMAADQQFEGNRFVNMFRLSFVKVCINERLSGGFSNTYTKMMVSSE